MMLKQSLKPSFILFILSYKSSFLYASQNCFWKSDKTDCGILVSSEPIAQLTLTQRVGVTLETCLYHFETFDWEVAIYCPDLNFCGLGLDLSLDYRSMWDREAFLPAKHTCSVITNTKENTCEELMAKMYTAGLFSS